MSVRSVRLSICLSVSLSKPVLYRNDWTNRAGIWRWGFLPPVPHCVVRKFGYLQKLGYFPVELCPKLGTWKISPRQIDRVVNNSSTVELVDDTYTTVDESWLFTTSRSNVTLQLHYCDFVLHLSYNLYLQLTRFRLT